MDRIILHCDMNNFFASVEGTIHADLKNLPMAVSGNPLKRTGIILAKNYLAKVFGVKTGEPISSAKQKCPTLICVSPHYEKYSEYSRKAYDIYSRFTDMIEPFGIDEVWLDITKSIKLFGSAKTIATQIQNTIFAELGLTISIGISWSKTMSKIASDMKKPMGLVEINRENHPEYMKKLKIRDMLFVGKKLEHYLEKMNIHTIYDIMMYDKKLLKDKFGVNGARLHDLVNGINDDDVLPSRYDTNKSIGNGRTFPKDLNSKEEIMHYIYMLSDMVAGRMRSENVCATVVHLSIKYSDFSKTGAQKKVYTPICSSEDISVACYEILNTLIQTEYVEPVRALRVRCTDLVSAANYEQLNFFTDKNTKNNKLGETIDKVRKKYGKNAIFFLNNEL